MNLYGFFNFVFISNVFGAMVYAMCIISNLVQDKIDVSKLEFNIKIFVVCLVVVLIFIFVFKWGEDKEIGDQNW